MSNIVKFTEGNKELYLFELDGKVSTIAPELLAFEGYSNIGDAWYNIKKREEFEDGYEFKTLQGEDLKAFKQVLKSEDLDTLVCENRKTLYEQYKSVPRLDIVLEEGIFGVMYTSNSGNANKFKKFMRREVNPKLNSDGKFDIVENEISKIEDETERILRSKVKGYEDLLVLDSSDRMANAMLTNYKLELSQYLQSKEIKEVKDKVEEIAYKVNRSVVVREGDKTAEAVARQFSIFSTSNKPHIKFAELMAKKLGFYIAPDGNIGHQDEYITVNLIQRGGTEVPALKYSKEAVKLMSESLENEGLEFVDIDHVKQGSNKGKFRRAKIEFDTGNIWINETTYNLYK